MQPPNRNPDQALQRLLALKRHEVPPPGFFDRLPNRILVNIRAGTEVSDLPWWDRLTELLVREPMLAGSYTALIMGALLFGVSVFQTATGKESPPALSLIGSDLPPPGMVFPATASLPDGMIYRATVPDTSEWIRSEPRTVQFYDTSLIRTLPGLVEVTEPVLLRLPR